ncbi:hypothetical protein SEA_TELAVIV_121 [Mycobacterium phage TelAviv]|uniref:Uncharacterized protein n=1 Tax=Mycobacterium phage Catdawg TaxID=1340819 RepID=S5Y3N2_9CAUD|nr:hypothetical protein PBI_CATDAWG_126 [Mycobacterium phage Catdawg]AYQ98962.1 hypothetical protein SEA_VORRPS_125 [Mycobacterium phage Vorrps]QFP97173.1 hypothetical protein SEA_KRILI_127 [Mycobacterium phage Krili]QOC58553.1 hypothetical protein SEA_SHIDA_124 [Mycobacterium phage Shida]QPO16607.1 hypothetical protein SEA_TELAVIV_121 [Mycobacterium phage TelAviv]QXO13497.1 hypothetical protein SEA_MURAI_125 [Mycobacterium phage Murai]URM87900.1 hypothetical protein SEA_IDERGOLLASPER_129 [My
MSYKVVEKEIHKAQRAVMRKMTTIDIKIAKLEAEREALRKELVELPSQMTNAWLERTAHRECELAELELEDDDELVDF